MPIVIHTIEQLSDLLTQTPLLTEQISPVSLTYLSEMPRTFDDAISMICVIDTPDAIPNQPMIALQFDSQFAHRFPTISCQHNPYTPALNRVINTHTDFIQKHTLTQNEIAHVIIEDCFKSKAEGVVLMLIDGLSYGEATDWDEFPSPIPCFVPGLTTTSEGCQNIIGRDTPLSMKLFDIGYRYRFGFTYWARETNALTDVLFRTISPNRIATVFSMAEVFDGLKSIDFHQAYVQIVRTGLDPYAHASRLDGLSRGRDAARQSLRDDLHQIQSILTNTGKRLLFYVVSDHGILWRDEEDFEVIAQASGRVNPRYYDLKTEALPSGDPCRCTARQKLGRFIEGNAERAYFQLTYPYVRRPLHRNEWGTHGGLSFQESIVPFLRIEVN